MLVSVVVELEGSVANVEAGRAVHAWFLNQIALVDPALAAELHDAPGIKPFTTALAQGAGGQGWLRLTSLTWEVSAALLASLCARPAAITLGPAQFRLGAVHTQPGVHPWARHDRYERLARHWQQAEPSPWLRLEFATPTVFHSRGLHVPLPIPRLLVESWLTRWNTFSPLKLDENLLGYAEESLAVSRYTLRTQRAQVGEVATGGFVGACDLRVTRNDPDRLRQLHLLAAYSFYCGTGHWTTRGLGQTQPRPSRDPQDTDATRLTEGL